MIHSEISSAWDFGGKDIWEYIVPERIKNLGPDIADPEKRARWCQAIFYGGNFLHQWNEATELKTALLSACALQEGQRVLLIGKYADESGITQAISALIGPKGELSREEIGPQAVAAYDSDGVTPGSLQWDFNYFDSLPDESLDRVILFGATCHVRNWEDCAQQVHRVLRDGGRVIIADAPWGGKELLTAANMESHLRTILETLLSGMKLKEEDLPTTGTEELTATFKPFLRWSRSFSWRGLHLSYGQKGGMEEDSYLELPTNTTAVKAFLTEKPSTSPWDFLASAEIAGLGSEIADVDSQKKWGGRAISYGGSADWAYEHASGVMYPMYTNLKVEPGYRVLVIGEWLERLFLPEIRRRVGESGEIVAFDIQTFRSLGIEDIGPKRTNYDFIDFADRYLTYPDNYFDLIWMPQGVHHVVSWKEFAPRLFRVLKPGHQVMMLEWRHPSAIFLTAVNMSGLLDCIASKIYWAAGHAFQDIPDVPTADLHKAIGDLLTDTYSIEWFGFLLYWGYKR